MAGPRAYYSPCRNLPPTSKNKLAGVVLTKGSGTPTPTHVVSYAPIFAPAAALTPLFASAAAALAARYLAKDFQEILITILKARAPALQLENFCERPLKAWAPDLYRSKTHMEYYNFWRKCENYFATTGAMGLNCIPFAATFLKDQALFCGQQYQRKLANKTNVSIT